MPRAGKRILHKGRNRRFTNPEELEEERKREEKKRQWRATHGGESTDEEDEAAGGDENKSEESGSETESETDSEEEVKSKAKGVENLIEIENPNRVQKKTKKLSKLNESLADTSSSKPELSRREREELEKQRAAAHYQRLHAEGKTEEARQDLARLAIIKQQREEAARKREEEKKRKRKPGRPVQYKCQSCYLFGKNRSAPVLCSNSTSYILLDLKSALKKMRGEVINSLDYAHCKLDVGNRKLQDQKKVIESVQKLAEDIQSENELLKERISSLQVKLEDVEQLTKTNNLGSRNLPKVTLDESPEKTLEFVQDIGKILGTSVTAEMLDICNRTRKPQDSPEVSVKEAAKQAKTAAVNKAIGKRT